MVRSIHVSAKEVRMAADMSELILALTMVPPPPSDAPSDVTLAVAAARAGALAMIDVSSADRLGATLGAFRARSHRPVGLRPGALLAATGPTPDAAGTAAVSMVLLGAELVADLVEADALGATIERWSPLGPVMVEVTSVLEARLAVSQGAGGLVAKGSESGGRVGQVETFVLIQHTVDLGVPVWARGGIGLHTAAGAIALGARGVVLDSQLALVRESRLPAPTRAAIAAMDGSETRVIGSHRIYTRPDLAVASRPAGEASAVVAAELGPDLRTDLVPVGQDGAAAAGLADRFKTAGGVIEGVRRAIGSHLGEAADHAPLQPGHGVAQTHRTRYPIAQGPMTRVSDQAEFAAAVADGGGLPFLALALMRGAEVEPLLAQTTELLGDRPWGVGILGFVPPELRDEQLEVVARAHPPVALIAGGRPSQAAPLEAAGIPTYLHVPSPGLLDRFVKDGARRFVFEGRECGGHVGPRSSFPLWETQVERLCAVDDPENLHVLFAGGIHDARSAAAVAAIGAPLAARGARLGVLMGTAYLFTAEAVSRGAITPAFQDIALGCTQTVLLETSPGHATRCVETDYVRDFAEAKARLEGDQVAADDMWAQLETLNLGRLRIASKGLVHGTDGLVAVDEAAQRRDGMFMIGQVATLRGRVTTIAALHDDVSAASSARIEEVAAEVVAPTRPHPAPAPFEVAIVGMASMFPGSASTDEFWTHIVSGVNAITEVPISRWDPERYFDPESTTVGAGRKTPSKWGGFLSEIGFDPLAYGIPPASLAAIEPLQLLSLEVATRALDDAGYADREFDRSRASVVFGAEGGNDLAGGYGLRAMAPQLLGEVPPELDGYLPVLTEDSFPGVLTNVIAGRIANRLDLGGSNFTVDAACAASLAALDSACTQLAAGTSDLVLCGGADVHNGINDFLMFSSVHALSPTGQCRTFDATADGIALGEGVACVVLKRLADAERDGDRIYAVIDGVGGSSDGRHLGLTAPRKEGQQRAVERALAQARRSPAEVGLVEAHGTGTVVGDRTELATLTEVFAAHDAEVGACVLGSVKSQIGHTKCAAGLAGLIKVTRSLYHGVLPPTGNLVSPNPAYDASTSPFRFLDQARPWVDDQRRAGVSAFGFGGANFHAVLSAYTGADEPRFGVETWPAELFVFRAARAAEAVERVEQLSTVVDAVLHADPQGQRHRLRDLAASVCATGQGPVQVAVVATDFADLADKLVVARSGTARRDGVFLAEPESSTPAATAEASADGTGTLAFLYPGQGSQRTGMLADLFVAFPHLRPLLRLGDAWADALYPPTVFTAEARAAQTAALTDTRVAQPALGLCELALTRLLGSVGVRPEVTAGHSYGELAALAAAGVLTPQELLTLSQARGHAIVDAAADQGDDPGAMAAINGSVQAVTELLDTHPGAVVANHNSPTQVVIAGPTAVVEHVVQAAAEVGMGAKTLNVACAFHSPVLATASPRLADVLEATTVASPEIPVWANTTAAPYPSEPDQIRRLLATQVTSPVRFVDQIEAMYAAGVRVFVEAGPGRVLTQLVDKILGDRPHRAIATDVSGEPGLRRFLLALAELSIAGVPVATDELFEGRADPVRLGDLPVRAPGWTVDGHLVRTASGQVVPGSLQPSDQFPVLAVGPGGADPEREGAVLDYLQNMREAVAAERDVMLRYLGAADGERTVPRVLDAASTPAAPPDPVPDIVLSDDGAAAVAPGPLRGDDLMAVVLALVADRTGYPTDMLDPDLDLEADLSIDSIKRIEIIGELAERLGWDTMAGEGIDEAMVEELAQLKSLREIVAWIDQLDEPPADQRGHELADRRLQYGDGEAGGRPESAPVEVEPPPPTTRYVVTTVDLDPLEPQERRIEGTAVVIADDRRGVGSAVAARFEALGASVSILAADGPPTDAELARVAEADGVIWLRALHPDVAADPGAFDARAVFPWWQPALLGRVTTLIAATAGAGSFVSLGAGTAPGLGLAGMAKSLSRELHDRTVRIVDVDPGADPDSLATCIVDEFFAPEGPVEVGYDGPQRVTRVVAEEPCPPSDEGPARLATRLGSDAVVLLTGGARGITAQAAVAIARTCAGCRIELAGRSPWPADEAAAPSGSHEAALAAAADRAALRQVLLDAGTHTTPAAIEAECSRLLADREIRATLSTLEQLGSVVTYHQVDVRDAGALGALVADIEARWGRLDLVVHGAGVLDDRFLRDKTAEGFDRVFATKVDAARTLLETLPSTTPVAFFGSVSGVFGNRGQVDYAAANDALDELATVANVSRPARTVSLDWGPWAGTGMVSPELEREYARRGIGLISCDDGVAALLDELAATSGPGRVVVMRARPEAMSPEPAAAASRFAPVR
jgi:acyl transferase domain-containing protein/NAD(P)H-dependent flavin oxidoreductase YrpB (nitropropane dioxygenase family)/NAD(P)-dependent dehydrogenase (short-subunit alcohol dehydrogenase family)